MTKKFFIQIASACGIGAMLFDVFLITLLGFLTPSYDPIKQHISELGARQYPYSPIINWWWGIYSFFLIVFAIGLYMGIRKTRLSWLGPLMLIVESVGNGVLSGFFSCDIGCQGAGFSNQIHLLASGIGTIISVFMPSFISVSIAADNTWKQSQKFLIIIQILMIMIVIYPFYREYLLMFFGLEFEYAGLFQRLYTLMYYFSLFIPAKFLYTTIRKV